MAIFHAEVKIIGRNSGRLAVPAAAYRSGDRLYDEETGIMHDYTKKGGVIMNEILLPEFAPTRLAVRQVLWNEIQKNEKRADAQLAREVEVGLPVEMTRSEQIECVRMYIIKNFVQEGMIADWALHDKGTGNPHAHIMLTMRGFDENGQWMKKQKSVFANAFDENGKPVFDPEKPFYDPKNKSETSQYRIPALDKNGKQKTRVRKGKGTEYLWEKVSIPVNDWNEHSKVEEWRASWAEHCNRYLEENKKIDHRSYKRQGLDIMPTIHEGVTARKMEVNGRMADRCEINRDIRLRNSLAVDVKELSKKITAMINKKVREVYERFKGFGRRTESDRSTGADAGSYGEASERERGTAQTAERITDAKRASGETDRSITETDQYIEKLRGIKKQKEAERSERIRKLTERRSALRRSGTADRGAGGGSTEERSTERTAVRSTGNDIRSFLGELRAAERSAEEERRDREVRRSRSDTGRERETEKIESGMSGRNEEVSRRNRSR